MDQLDAMRMFVRVAELESFTRSAEQLSLPKATLSATIRRLEEQMGTRLLQRTTRRVQLTPDGKLCYARCQDLLASGELVAILPKWQAPPLPIHALYAHRRQLAPRVQAFIQWLSGILASALEPDGLRDGGQQSVGGDAAD